MIHLKKRTYLTEEDVVRIYKEQQEKKYNHFCDYSGCISGEKCVNLDKNYYVLYIDKLKVVLDNFVIPQLTSDQGYVSLDGVSRCSNRTYYSPPLISFTLDSYDQNVLDYFKHYGSNKVDIFLEVINKKGEIIQSKVFVGCFVENYETKFISYHSSNILNVTMSFDLIKENFSPDEKTIEKVHVSEEIKEDTNFIEDIILI